MSQNLRRAPDLHETPPFPRSLALTHLDGRASGNLTRAGIFVAEITADLASAGTSSTGSSNWPRRPKPLTALLLRLAHPANAPEITANQVAIFQHATTEEIRSAVARIAQSTRRILRPEELQDVRLAILYLGDFPEPHRGRLPGLAQKAIRWHQDLPRANRPAVAGGRGPGKWDPPTVLPTIPLPKDPRVTFLASASQIIEEGELMGHCIGSYVEKAIDGRCFLFHVEYGGSMASVEVNLVGRVVQSCGPRNTANPATV